MSNTGTKTDYPIDLPRNVQRQLLFLARQSIADYLFHIRTAQYIRVDSVARMRTGVFVTLSRGTELRGCIGIIEGKEVLPVAIREMAIAAASRDPRFRPVDRTELVHLTIEISVLSEPEPISSLENLEIGRHGLLVRKGARQGLLLPQVAPKAGWGPEDFFKATCIKADLQPELWQKGKLEVFAFVASVFSDEDFEK